MEDDQDGAGYGSQPSLMKKVWESWAYSAWSRDSFGASQEQPRVSTGESLKRWSQTLHSSVGQEGQ